MPPATRAAAPIRSGEDASTRTSRCGSLAHQTLFEHLEIDTLERQPEAGVSGCGRRGAEQGLERQRSHSYTRQSHQEPRRRLRALATVV